MNLLPLALLAWLSPVQVYASQVLGASLRMQLSQWAVGILQMLGKDVVAQGNRFEWAGQVFYVDPACAGLDMLLTSAIFALLFAGYFEKRHDRRLGWLGLGLLMGWVIAWVILANLLRIVGIVLAQAPPETFVHEAVGIGCLIMYGLLPAALGANLTVRWLSRPFVRQPFRLQPLPKNAQWAVLASMAILWGILLFRPSPTPQKFAEKPALPGFEYREAALGVAGFRSDQSLVFIKPPVPFWGADHTPSICWRAEGYQLRGEREGTVCGAPIWIAELHKPGKILYTAWWYDNQREIVAGQWDWRWNTAKGNGPYRLVNVTVTRMPDLLPEAARVMALLAPNPNPVLAQQE
jgi:exosortase N